MLRLGWMASVAEANKYVPAVHSCFYYQYCAGRVTDRLIADLYLLGRLRIGC